MAKVKIQGNASGTGVITLIAPNTNTDRTVTLPDESITLGGGVDGIVSTADATAITIDSSENVGIGVVPKSWQSAWKPLQISTTSVFAGNSGGYTAMGENFYRDASTYKYVTTSHASKYWQYDGTHQFKVAPSGTADAAITWTTALEINNSGDIIQNNPTTGNDGKKFQKDSSIKVYRAGTADAYYFTVNNANGEVGRIRATGSTTSYNTSSDYRLKENVVPMTGSIDRLKALKPSKFNFIADADKTVDGFLAHEAGEVVPECEDGIKDAMRVEEYEVTPAVMDGEKVVTEAVMGEREVPDYQGIDQSKLVPLLVASLQEAVARIEVLEAQLNA
jgi:hypothetical protein